MSQQILRLPDTGAVHTRRIMSMIAMLIVITSVTYGQGTKPVTADDLIAMQKEGLSGQTMVKAIEANGADLDTSAAGLMVLKKAGLPDAVIDAALDAGRHAKPIAATSPVDGTEVGVYLLRDGSLQQLKLDPTETKTGGLLGGAIPLVGKVKMEAVIRGAKSTVQIPLPTDVVIHCTGQNAPESYRLIVLDQKKDHREFTFGKVGALGQGGGGVAEQGLPLTFAPIGKNVYKTTLQNLKPGEYAFVYGQLVYSFGIAP